MASLATLFRHTTVPTDGVKAVGSLLGPLPSQDSAAGSVVWGSQGRPGGGRFSGRSARRHLEAYAGRQDAIGWAMICCNLIAETASNAPWHFETRDGKELPKTRAEADAYERPAPIDLVMLLENPNPWQTWEDLVELLFIDWLITGDFFLLKWGLNSEAKPVNLFRLNPSLVEVLPGGSGEPMITGYEYAVPGESKVTFSPDEILHVKRPNPHSEFRGAGIIAGDPRMFDMAIALTDTKAEYYEHGAKLSGVLETEKPMNDGLIAKIARQFMGKYSGRGNAHKVAVLERGLKFNAISNSAVDAAFGPISQESRDFILAMFGIPHSMLGIEAKQRQAPGQAAEDRREFSNTKMRPVLDKFQAALTNGLVGPGWDLKLCIDYKYQMPIESKITLATEFATLPGVTIREVREFADLEPLGDERDEIVLNLPGNNENASNVKDRPLGQEPGRPPKGENTAAVPKPGEPMPGDATAQPKPAEEGAA